MERLPINQRENTAKLKTNDLLAAALVGALAIATTQAQQAPLPKTAADVPGPAAGTAMTNECVRMSAEEAQIGGEATVNADATRPASWMERDRLTGDWGGSRTWLKEHGITLAPRLTQFYQGLSAGDGDHDFEYGGKADLMLNADLRELGFWKGLSLTVHGEYNYGESINGAGGTLVPPNTALLFELSAKTGPP